MAMLSSYIDCSLGAFFFDAVFSTEISSEMTITSSPIQEGADVSDHAYVNGKNITFDIGMSDVMEGINLTFVGDSTRSINAYNFFDKLQNERLPISLVNKFGTFKNLLVSSVLTKDTKETQYGLRATVTLKEIFVARVGTIKVSQRPHQTDNTNLGNVNAIKLDKSEWYKVLENNNIIRGENK